MATEACDCFEAEGKYCESCSPSFIPQGVRIEVTLTGICGKNDYGHDREWNDAGAVFYLKEGLTKKRFKELVKSIKKLTGDKPYTWGI